MIEIKINTKIKLTVASCDLVGYATIPPFKIYPDSVTWGTRIFYAHGLPVFNADVGTMIYEYREGFNFAIVTEVKDNLNWM